MKNTKTTMWLVTLGSLAVGTFALAQPKPAEPTACDQCPMKAAAELSDIKVELTKDGALIRLRARRAEDLSKVQQNAQQLATALSRGDCMMHAGEHGTHGHGHGAGHGHGPGHGQGHGPGHQHTSPAPGAK